MPEDPPLHRLRDQLAYYESAAARSQKCFRAVKLAQLIVAAAVPVAAAAHAGVVLTASIGAVILILEGVQALFSWQQNWINYRNTAEALKAEEALYVVPAGPYSRTTVPRRLLAERVEALLASERAGWVAGQIPQHQREGGTANGDVKLTADSERPPT